MRARYKGPSGTGVVEFEDTATVHDVLDQVRAKSGISRFTIKYGPPMAMKTISPNDVASLATTLKLHGETLTIVPEESAPEALPPASEGFSHPSASNPRAAAPPSATKPEDIVVPWAEREGTLLLRVMPSDNSCLFTAFGGALQDQLPAPRLRKMMAEYILEHPDVYSEAVLGSPPSQYCRSIQDPDRWGGGIELSILSTIFNIQISTFDVQTQNLMNFGEDKQDRCILVYSGIHYDRVAFTYTPPPHDVVNLPPEIDRTVWPTDDDEVLSKTQDLLQKLHSAHYYTDTDGLVLKCDVPGCDWIGSGQAAGQAHAQATGHVDLTEIRDQEDDSLRACDAPGCGFMAQGEGAARSHTRSTGHERFSIIPDM